MSWRALEASAPAIARLGEERLEQTRVALLGTLRSDGWPRISAVEPYISDGQLLFGAMSWSLKTNDLLRDPRPRQRRRGAQALRARRRGRRRPERKLPGLVGRTSCRRRHRLHAEHR